MAHYLKYITEIPVDPFDRTIAYDPINLVFYGNAPVPRVVSHLQDPGLNLWKPSPLPRSRDIWTPAGGLLGLTTQMWAWLDNSDAGGWRGWKLPDEEVAVGPYMGGTRMHIRIYGSNNPELGPTAPPDPDLGLWSVAAIHREHWVPPRWHVVHGWEDARDFAEEWFAQAAGHRRRNSGIVSVTRDVVSNAGWYQGYWHDGNAVFIQLA